MEQQYDNFTIAKIVGELNYCLNYNDVNWLKHILSVYEIDNIYDYLQKVDLILKSLGNIKIMKYLIENNYLDYNDFLGDENELNLSNNIVNLEDIDFFNGKIEKLSIKAYNKIKNPQYLNKMNSLMILKIDNHETFDLNNITNCKNLINLNIKFPINYFKPLKHLTQLSYLFCNLFKNMNSYKCLEGIEYLPLTTLLINGYNYHDHEINELQENIKLNSRDYKISKLKNILNHEE